MGSMFSSVIEYIFVFRGSAKPSTAREKLTSFDQSENSKLATKP
jgi:hypothetical protein